MSTGHLIESLEARKLFAISLGTNLLVNGGAEDGPASSSGDQVNNILAWDAPPQELSGTVIPYGAAGFIAASDPGPSNRGKNFFGGGRNLTSALIQTIDLSDLASEIDAGRIKYNFAGWFGGFGTEGDVASPTLFFNPSTLNVLAPAPVDREGVTKLSLVTMAGNVPPKTRSVTVRIGFARVIGNNSDGYADNLSFELSSTQGSKGRIAGRVINDTDADGRLDDGEVGIKGVRLFLDKDNDGKLDTGETFVSADSKGRYAFEGLSAGSYKVRTVLPSGFRSITTNPQTLKVSAGLTTSSNMLLSQQVLITGVAFIDNNFNHKRDTGDDVRENFPLSSTTTITVSATSSSPAPSPTQEAYIDSSFLSESICSKDLVPDQTKTTRCPMETS